ncbi:hypothetical protein BH24CHL4_BH24CHL4_15200 [soil metagenome]
MQSRSLSSISIANGWLFNAIVIASLLLAVLPAVSTPAVEPPHTSPKNTPASLDSTQEARIRARSSRTARSRPGISSSA